MAKMLPSIKLPTPFGGEVSLPELDTPPLELPKKPDARGMKVVGHGLGQDVADLIRLIPWVGEVVGDMLEDMHTAEVQKILTPDEYLRYLQYNKIFPASVAIARIVCFRKV